MSVKPILFSAPMVRALLDGRKTQTRRVMKDQATWDRIEALVKRFPRQKSCVPYAPGDLLYVREAAVQTPDGEIVFKADLTPEQEREHDRVVRICGRLNIGERFRPGIHMPRAWSRLTLRVTDVRVQRVQDISEADARAEGCPGVLGPHPDFPDEWDPSPREQFQELWDSLNAPRGFGWDENPWVAAVTFEAIKANVDELANTRERAEREEQ